ncbi:MAG: hypothetical protein ACI85O_000366 [Saprospiraceae bacterium]|jgi:hypothetical protein
MYHDKIKRPEEKKNSASLSSAENSTDGGTTLAAPALQFKKEGEEEESVQMKKGQSSGGHSSSAMPDEVHDKMENSFQSDFSNVNFHTNSHSATDVGALAYAQGNDVHFAPGQFKPNTQSGQELIGHELAHVVQ